MTDTLKLVLDQHGLCQPENYVTRAHDRLALARKELALLAGAAVTMGLAGLAEPLHRIKSIVEDAQQDLAREEQST
jgi:hypothetical protein